MIWNIPALTSRLKHEMKFTSDASVYSLVSTSLQLFSNMRISVGVSFKTFVHFEVISLVKT